MRTEGERLATVEAVLVELREDLSELKTEALRTRSRLHQVENTAALFLKTQEDNRLREAEQYRVLGLKIQWAGIALAAAAVIVQLSIVFLTGK